MICATLTLITYPKISFSSFQKIQIPQNLNNFLDPRCPFSSLTHPSKISSWGERI